MNNSLRIRETAKKRKTFDTLWLCREVGLGYSTVSDELKSMVQEGLLTSEHVKISERSSFRRFAWIGEYGVWLHCSGDDNIPWKFYYSDYHKSHHWASGDYIDDQLFVSSEKSNLPKEIHDMVSRALFKWVYHNEIEDGAHFFVRLPDDAKLTLCGETA